MIGYNKVEHVATYDLKSLGADSSVSGRSYFLGGGYIDGKRVLSYVMENADGSFTPDQVDANDSKIYEDEGTEPEMRAYEHSADYWWLAPSVFTTYTYEFTVPNGTVVEEYTVAP